MKNLFIKYSFILVGVLCFMLAAFYNKFPLVYSDTGTYLCSGFDRFFPFDRPITYGLFVRYISFNGYSLWLPVFLQSFLLSYVIFLFIKLVLGNSFRYWITALIYIFLSLFTSASWVSSMIMTDVFTPIGILCGAIILYGALKKGELVFVYILFLLAAATHFSHILIFSLLFAGVFSFKKWMLPKNIYPFRYIRAVLLVLLTLISILIMKPSLDKGKSIMFVSTMMSQGITQEYLKEYCGTKHYILCAYKDSIPVGNMVATWFEYDPGSPLAKLGGWTDTVRNECTDIMYATLTKPKYIWLHILASLRCSFLQLYSFKTGGGNVPYMKEYPVLANVRCHFKRDLDQYSNSKQNKDILLSICDSWNMLLTIVIIVSCIALILIFILNKKVFSDNFGCVTILLLAGIIVNAWDCGTFSDINLRYGSRIMWFLPFLASLAMIRFLNKKTST